MNLTGTIAVNLQTLVMVILALSLVFNFALALTLSSYARRVRSAKREARAFEDLAKGYGQEMDAHRESERNRPVLHGIIKKGKAGRHRLTVRDPSRGNALVAYSGANGYKEREPAEADANLLSHARIEIVKE